MEITDFPATPFRFVDAERRGLTRRQVRRALDCGMLRRFTRAVYGRIDLADDVETRARAAALAVAPHHVAINRTAGWVLGLDMLTMTEHDTLPPVETAALRGRNPTRRPEVNGRTRDLSPDDIIEIDGLRLTGAVRTALDLGCELHRRDAFASLVMLARTHGFSRADLALELPRFRGRRGVVQCRSLVPLVDPRIESVREAWTYITLYDAGLPLPEPQVWIEIDGEPVYRLDFAWEHAKVCVEYDGVESHERTTEQREHDDARRDWLRAEGWVVIVVRRGDFTGEALARWIAEVREALAPSYTNRRW
jgi:hypothetical protein